MLDIDNVGIDTKIRPLCQATAEIWPITLRIGGSIFLKRGAILIFVKLIRLKLGQFFRMTYTDLKRLPSGMFISKS